MFTVQPTFSIRLTPRDYRGPFSRMSIRNITFDNADKPILSLCRRSKMASALPSLFKPSAPGTDSGQGLAAPSQACAGREGEYTRRR